MEKVNFFFFLRGFPTEACLKGAVFRERFVYASFTSDVRLILSRHCNRLAYAPRHVCMQMRMAPSVRTPHSLHTYFCRHLGSLLATDQW